MMNERAQALIAELIPQAAREFANAYGPTCEVYGVPKNPDTVRAMLALEYARRVGNDRHFETLYQAILEELGWG